MNIVITLPKHLIKAIIMGEKAFEIRSKVPLHFDERYDVIFVVQKGTKKIPIYFNIQTFCHYTKFEEITFLAKKAAVSTDFIAKYWEEKGDIYAWVIGCACKVSNPSFLYSELKINKNPQSYIYRDFQWRKIHFNAYVWLNKPAFFIPSLEYKRYYRCLSSAKPSTL